MVVGTALAAVGLVGAPGTDAIWIGAGAVIWVITTAVLAPVLGHPVLVACRGVFGRLFGTAGRLAGENALRNPRRTGATASALMIGLAVVSAVGVLASSLSATNDAVVDDQFKSDFLVQMPTFQGFPSRYGDRMEDVDGVDLVSRQQGDAGERRGRRQAGPDVRHRRRPGLLRDLRPDHDRGHRQDLRSPDDPQRGPRRRPEGRAGRHHRRGVPRREDDPARGRRGLRGHPDHGRDHVPAVRARRRRYQAQRLHPQHHARGRRRPRSWSSRTSRTWSRTCRSWRCRTRRSSRS